MKRDVWTLSGEYDGVTERFRLLPFDGTLQKDGETFRLTLNAETAADIVDRSGYGSERQVPVDMEHFLFLEAEAEGQEEGEYLAALPGESLAAGFVKLTAEKDGIYANVIRWVPRALALLKAKAYRYFSPVIRGLQEGRPRITSIALTNQPALYDIEPLTLTAEPKQEESNMEFLKKLAALLKLDDAEALSEPNKLEPLIEGRVLSLVEVGNQVEALTAERDAAMTKLVERNEADAAADLAAAIAEGKAQGKLTEAMAEWAGSQSAVALRAFLEKAPVVVKIGKTIDPNAVPLVGEQTGSESPESRSIAEGFQKFRELNNKKKEG